MTRIARARVQCHDARGEGDLSSAFTDTKLNASQMKASCFLLCYSSPSPEVLARYGLIKDRPHAKVSQPNLKTKKQANRFLATYNLLSTGVEALQYHIGAL